MNCKPGDLAYIVVPAGFDRTLDGKFVVVDVPGPCDLGTFLGSESGWMCKFSVPWVSRWEGRRVRQCWLIDSWLRPIRDPGDDAVDQTLVPGYAKDEVTA